MPSVPGRGVHEVKFARIVAPAAATTEIVAAVAGKKIRVISYVVTVNAVGEIEFQDDAGTPKELAHHFLAANGGVSFAGDMEAPAFETGVGQALDIVTITAQRAEGHLAFIEV